MHNIPNLISVLRLLLVPLTVWLIISEAYGWAFVTFMVAGISDGIDGYLARRFDWRTRLGAYLDPLADKTLLVSVFVTLGLLKLIPAWLVITVVSRDALIIGAVLLFWIGVQLLVPEGDHEGGIKSASNLWTAVRTILIADLVMSLDNVIAVAAAAKGSLTLLIIGLAISIPLVVFASTIALVTASLLPAWFGAGPIYIAGASIGGSYFLYKAWRLARVPNRTTALGSFFASLFQLAVLLAAASIDGVIR